MNIYVGPTISQLNQLLPIGQRTGAIYSLLFKYTQHTVGFTDNNWNLLWPALHLCILVY